MLLGILTGVGVVVAIVVALCAKTAWLLGAVAGFVAGFLGALLLALAFLAVLWLIVDTNKEQERDSKLYRFITHMYIEFVIKVCRVKIHAQGLEKIPTEGRFLLVCNHLSDIDPALLMHCFPKSQLAFVGKKETQRMPVIGAVMHKLLCQYLDRENDREALKSILKCIEIVKEDKASIGVFPEGYVSLDGKLRHFRGGVFKIAQRTGVPIVVCTVRGTWQAMKSILRLEPAEVEIHLVDVISGEEAKTTPTVEMAERVYEIMISDLGEALRTDEKGMHPDLQKQRMGQ